MFTPTWLDVTKTILQNLPPIIASASSVHRVIAHVREGDVEAELHLTLPSFGRPLVISTNGAGQAGFDEAHRFIAKMLQPHGFGSCYLRILRLGVSPTESDNREGRVPQYSFESIGAIILTATEFLRRLPELHSVKFCLLGSGDGAAAALFAAASRPAEYSALVSSGGRIATALTYSSKNTVPTLFLLGSEDNVSADTTRAAFSAVRGPKQLVEIRGAGHLLREPGAFEDAAEKTLRWFEQYAS